MSYVVTAFFGFASAFSHNFAMFATMRLFTGMGLAGISLITIVLGELSLIIYVCLFGFFKIHFHVKGNVSEILYIVVKNRLFIANLYIIST